jgi:2',3'-cyclic-nucleotide 2'-phosphodiesterase (5'-nucleotidase family)
MNRLVYDAAVPSDRDLDRTDGALAEAVAASAFPWLGANLRIGAGASEPREESPIRATARVDRGGVRIGVIGLVSPGVLLGKDPEFRKRLRIADAEEAARREAARLRGDAAADLVIAIGAGSAADESDREPGLLEDLALPNAAGVIADRTPGLDLVISGRGRIPRKGSVARPNRSYRVPLIEPVPSSRALTLVVLDVVRDEGGWRVAQVTQETQWAGEDADPDILAVTARAMEEARLRLAQRLPVYIAGRPIARKFQACAGTLGHAAAQRAGTLWLKAAGMPAAKGSSRWARAGTPPLSLLPSLWAQPRWTRHDVGRRLTRGDIGRWISQDDPLVFAELTGRQISLLLEPYVRQMHGWRTPTSQVLYPGGLDVALAPKRSEAVSVRLAGALDAVQDYRRYFLWMARYHRFGGGGLAARALIEPDQPARILPLTLREAVLDYLAAPAAPLPEACAKLLSRQPPEPRTRRVRIRSALHTGGPDVTVRSLRTRQTP